MKFTPSREAVFNTNETKSFNMAVNAKSFSILTSGIYQNKIRAIIREYSTNAFDAHLESGNSDPINVHLPTNKEPFFYVEDFGQGLNEYEFEKVFFTFFESTKDETNDFNGCLGLGAKSGFSYNTKSFTVESHKDGKHLIYNCFLGKDGAPEYSLLHNGESTRENGVKVTIPVSTYDIYRFYTEAEYVYKAFSVTPNFIGKNLDISPVMKDEDSYIINNNRGCLALMGNVLYPINESSELSNYSEFINSRIVVRFNNGDLNFNPSRETLEYNDRTINNIKRTFNNIKYNIVKDIEKEIDGSKNEWQAILNYKDLMSKHTSTQFISKINFFKFKGKRLETNYGKEDANFLHITSYGKQYNKSKFLISSSIKYVINDLKKGSITRCKMLAKGSGCTVILLSTEQYNEIDLTHSKDHFIMASTLPKPTYNRSPRNNLGKLNKLVNSVRLSTGWIIKEESEVTDKVYVIRKAYRPFFNGVKTTQSSIIHRGNKAGYEGEIYGIKESDEEKFKKAGWKRFEKVLEDKIKKIKSEFNKDKDFYIKYLTYNNFINENSNLIKLIKQNEKSIPVKSQALEILKIYNDFQNNKTKFKKVVDNLSALKNSGIDINLSFDKKLKESIDKLAEQYTMKPNCHYLSIVDRVNSEDYLKFILGVDYVNGNL